MLNLDIARIIVYLLQIKRNYLKTKIPESTLYEMSTTMLRGNTKQNPGLCTQFDIGSKSRKQVPADSNSINLRHFKDFLRPQLSKFKTYANQMLLTRSSERLDSRSPTGLWALK